MRFEIQFPEGVPHEVELQGRLVVVGRDPSCDLVLLDVKCSRRHAVLEAGPDGITVRDTGSANGVFVNDQKVGRAALKAGDVLRLGDSVVRVLPDDVEGTVVMGPAETTAGESTIGEEMQPPPLPRRPPPLPPRGEAAVPRVEAASLARRPLTANVLAALWLMSVPIYALGGIALAMRSSGPGAFAWATAGVLLAGLGSALAWGLWSSRPWARGLQVAVAALGLLVCPFTLASAVVLGYMLSPVGAAAFSGKPGAEDRTARHEPAFAAALLGTVLLGALLTLAGILLPQVASRVS